MRAWPGKPGLVLGLLLFLVAAQTVAAIHVHVDDSKVVHVCELCAISINLIANVQSSDFYVLLCLTIAFVGVQAYRVLLAKKYFSFQQRAPPLLFL